jgi:Ni,Fe-hydrogenase III large subunit
MTDPIGLIEFLADCPIVSRHRPWPRLELSRGKWRALADRLPTTDWELMALWGEARQVHACLRDPTNATIAVASLACPQASFPSLGRARPGAIRMERATRDLFGLVPEGLTDDRAWLDHGRWPLRRPLAAQPEPVALDDPAARATDYPFLPVEGEGLHQIPVGPVHAGIIEPGHFRFHANGETVVRLEARLGYVHKGIEKLMIGKPIAEAAKLAARVSGDSTVAHGLAFARAVEAALDLRPPPRADFIRAVMAELERIANHIGDFGAVCNDAAFTFLQAQATILREEVLRFAASAFGHRLMMDRVVPGGVVADLTAEAAESLRRLVARLGPQITEMLRVYDSKPSLLDRTLGTGIVAPHLVTRFAAGGYVGRASMRGFDARRSPGYHPYDLLDFDVPVLNDGDVHSRVMIRAREIEESLKLLILLLDRMPVGPITVELPRAAGEGLGIVEGFRGEIVTSVRIDPEGRIERCFPRDPSWLQWPLLEAAIEGNIVADFPLCNKSFNCSYSGHDL